MGKNKAEKMFQARATRWVRGSANDFREHRSNQMEDDLPLASGQPIHGPFSSRRDGLNKL